MKAQKRTLDTVSLQRFIDSIPSAEAIRARIDRNSTETGVLKRLLRLARQAEQARVSRQESPHAS